MELGPDDLAALRRAKGLLETTSLAARLANAIGTPVDKLLGALPSGATQIVMRATNKSIAVALDVALSTLGDSDREPRQWQHKAVVAAIGGAGGAFGLPALALELPVSTMVMLRSIAEIARNEGELLTSVESKLACVQVFALGGTTSADDAADTGYFAVRLALAKSVTEAVEYIAKRGVTDRGAPAVVKLVSNIASRFGVRVSQKAMAQLVPVIGAAGGAFMNVIFMDHYQDVARGHFVVRRLERQFGAEIVKDAYLRL
jgi:hypothetical protein